MTSPPLFRATRRVRGVSLIEALVALAVMAFGMLGVVGMQGTLRSSADQSKQRGEAVRLAQAEMERLRSFGLLSGAPGGEHDYSQIVTTAATSVVSSASAGYAGNATFERSVTVVEHAAAAPSAPRMKTITVAVTWRDRDFDATQAARDVRSVSLSSVVAELSPELGAGLGLPNARSAAQQPSGRHIAVPLAAVPGSVPGTSVFAPPGASSVLWVFSNATGVIEQRCTTTNGCVPFKGLLISGFVRFATGAAPDAAAAENPPGPAFDVGISIAQTWPTTQTLGTASGECFATPASATLSYVAYYCAVPIIAGTAPDFTWSGIVDLTLPDLAPLGDDTASNFKVCRYTTDPSTDTPAGGNPAHPLEYSRVSSGLLNQNFLIISAGSGTGAGTSAYSCPLDDATGTPLVDSDTKQHQPR